MGERSVSTSLIGEQVLEELAQTALRSPKGALVEVGVYQGGSALKLYQVAREQNRKLYLYDTFTGIPFKDAIDNHYPGDFGDCSYEHVKFMFKEAEVIKGVFPDSAIPMDRIAFAHLDCDQYRSVSASIAHLGFLMVPDGIMWFDDYGCLPGAIQAVDKWFPKPYQHQAVCGKTYVIWDEDTMQRFSLIASRPQK